VTDKSGAHSLPLLLPLIYSLSLKTRLITDGGGDRVEEPGNSHEPFLSGPVRVEVEDEEERVLLITQNLQILIRRTTKWACSTYYTLLLLYVIFIVDCKFYTSTHCLIVKYHQL